MTSIPLVTTDSYFKNFDKHTPFDRCVLCAKGIEYPKHWVHVGGGYATIITEDDPSIGDAGDMGLFPIGPECLRKHPELKPFLQ